MKTLLDLLFPPRCVGCGTRGTWLCRGCRDALHRIPAPRCRICSAPTGGVAVCAVCWRNPPPFESLIAEFRFDGVIRRAVHQLKYQRAQHLAEPLVDALLDAMADVPPVDIVVPVPLHASRLKSRGYNQAALLALELARRIDRPIAEAGLIRVKDTQTQVTLPAAHRWANVSDAFQLGVDGPSLVGKHVLLVDDVATTTSTLRAAARVLRQAGVSQINGLVAARATTIPPSNGTKVAPSDE